MSVKKKRKGKKKNEAKKTASVCESVSRNKKKRNVQKNGMRYSRPYSKSRNKNLNDSNGRLKKKKDDTHTKTEKQIIIKEKKGKILTRTGTGRIEREKIFFNSREKFYLFFSGHKIAIDDIHHIKHRKKKKR